MRSRLGAVIAAVGIVVALEPRLERAWAASEVTIQPLAHGSLRIEFAGRSIYVDPWSGANLTGSPQSDLIVITDADPGAHHLDPAALRQVRRNGGTVVIPMSASSQVPDGVVLPNGSRRIFDDVTVEAVAAYDLKPGAPFHTKGESNGYVLTLGDTRVFVAGVTECVPEIRALRDVDIALMPMNLPNGRMTPEAVAECVRSFRPKVVYPYHYDQGYIARRSGHAGQPTAARARASIAVLVRALAGVAEVRDADWYPAP